MFYFWCFKQQSFISVTMSLSIENESFVAKLIYGCKGEKSYSYINLQTFLSSSIYQLPKEQIATQNCQQIYLSLDVLSLKKSSKLKRTCNALKQERCIFLKILFKIFISASINIYWSHHPYISGLKSRQIREGRDIGF